MGGVKRAVRPELCSSLLPKTSSLWTVVVRLKATRAFFYARLEKEKGLWLINNQERHPGP